MTASSPIVFVVDEDVAVRDGLSRLEEQRGQVMQKMQVGSVAELIRSAGRRGIGPPGNPTR